MTHSHSQPDSVHHRIEEWINSATHGIGALLSVVGTVALIAGAVAACGFAPLDLWPLLLGGLIVLLALVQDAPTMRAALWRGWAFGVLCEPADHGGDLVGERARVAGGDVRGARARQGAAHPFWGVPPLTLINACEWEWGDGVEDRCDP